MGKSVFALILGVMLVLFSGVAYAYVRFTMADDTSESTESSADSGVAACEAIFAQPEHDSLDDVLAEDIVSGLKGSANADLQAAGETIERLGALPADQQLAASADLVTALSKIATGCVAVGVTLADVTGSAQPTST
jgi:hypothetical protein